MKGEGPDQCYAEGATRDYGDAHSRSLDAWHECEQVEKGIARERARCEAICTSAGIENSNIYARGMAFQILNAIRDIEPLESPPAPSEKPLCRDCGQSEANHRNRIGAARDCDYTPSGKPASLVAEARKEFTKHFQRFNAPGYGTNSEDVNEDFIMALSHLCGYVDAVAGEKASGR
jgi:hypothetical protein